MALCDLDREPRLVARLGRLARAIQEDDQAIVEQIVSLSRSRRLFAPLAFTVGAFAMLFQGLKLLLSNWRLLLVQIPPAVWIWLAMFDLKARVLHGRSFPALRGAVLIPIGLAIVAITVACFFLNAVFAFAIADAQVPKIRPAYLLPAGTSDRSSCGARAWDPAGGGHHRRAALGQTLVRPLPGDSGRES